MVRRKNPIKGKTVHLSAQVPAELMRAIDELAKAMSSELRVTVSRSDLIRKLLEEAIERTKLGK